MTDMSGSRRWEGEGTTDGRSQEDTTRPRPPHFAVHHVRLHSSRKSSGVHY